MTARIVSEIWIYPVKSFGGIQLQSAKVLPKGLEHDRRLMLIDEGNMFMTQREHHQMALFKTELVDQKFFVHHNGESIELNYNYSGNPIISQVWNDPILVYEVSKLHSDWFSDRLKIKCKLVVFPENLSRQIDPRYKINDDHVSLADGYPLLVIGQSSLDDLNGRMESPLPMNRFRPNLVFTGGEPFEEDHWSRFKIGESGFAAVKKCARCVLTTVNQDTAEKGIEPLATLAKYRRGENNVYFGQNLIPLNSGNEISVGQSIEILSKTGA